MANRVIDIQHNEHTQDISVKGMGTSLVASDHIRSDRITFDHIESVRGGGGAREVDTLTPNYFIQTVPQKEDVTNARGMQQQPNRRPCPFNISSPHL